MREGKELEEVKRWLRSYHTLIMRTRKARERLAEVRSELSSARALVYNDMPHGSGSLSDLSSAMVRLEEEEEKVRQAISESIKARADIARTIKELPPVSRRVLYDRYILLKSWDRIAKEHSASKRQVLYKHKEGLEIIRQKWDA